MSEPKRWIADIEYRHASGTSVMGHEVEELDEIADIVERGPHWDTIVEIHIIRNPATSPEELTVEEAAKL